MAKPSNTDKAADKAKEVATENGVHNPSGAAIAGFAALYLAFIPITSSITRRDSVVQSAIGLTLRLIPGLGPHPLPASRQIPALSALYTFFAFGASGAVSAAGQAMGMPEGLDNNSPRKHIHKLEGLPLRLRSAHYGLIENFAGFALAAGAAMAVDPQAQNQQVVNLLGLHVLLKVVVYYASYLADVPPPRTLSHVMATSAVVNVLWRLARAGV
ncbi:uncharacterized protein HMPREF1541_11024 [Cyphellophora europaea CBS 101466]|uniref:Uncharacterized protein n=1 Tax=Cyphellophora europaea (strain CBS 101466) TaxID=1220924 RepID=W2S791_CYPE1|nr:uncharacterized protein HMPREF1541_11024 [Cyphellophora europaea CBS 101466]ETN43893.1 hypothetical protein HMPREF1541_11024 [Cyphellophora europaea CBS 101466]